MISSTSRESRRVPRAATDTTRSTAAGSGPTSPSSSISNDPWIAVNGVRSSWLTAVTKEYFSSSS